MTHAFISQFKNVHVLNFCLVLLNKLCLFLVLPPTSVDIGGDPASWYDLGISYASAFELVLVSLALVYYASDMPNGKNDLFDFCQGIVSDSPDYQGHDHSWSSPDSWRRSRRFVVTEARQRITDAMSMRHRQADQRTVEEESQHAPSHFGTSVQ